MHDLAGRRLHFIGIGGAGMSGLALVARALGADVSGSDRAESAYLPRLREAGIVPAIGHAAANVPDGAEVVVSTAIPADNPELLAATGPVRHRSDLMAELARLRRCLAVTGTHGKTTTSSMVVDALRGAGMDPSYLVGGELRSTGANAGWGTGEWIVVEADESDRSLLKLTPELAILTNAELDHHSTYASRLDLEATFRTFLAVSRRAVVWDRRELDGLVPADAERYDAEAIDSSGGEDGVRFRWRGRQVALSVPGAHNAVNAAGALTAAVLAGADPAAAVAALAEFRGARRRFERLGRSVVGAELFDDYAHHPTEVAATVAAARTVAERSGGPGRSGRVVAVFQPHLFSRTRALAREFGAALAGADLAVVLDVYAARERAEEFPGVDGHLVAAAAADAGGGRPVAWTPAFADARAVLDELLREGDVCVLMGAGNIDELGRALAAAG